MTGRGCSCNKTGFRARARRRRSIPRPATVPPGFGRFAFEVQPFEFEADYGEAGWSDEWSVGKWESVMNEAPPAGSMKPCPLNSPGYTTDRCTGPGQQCPAIPDLMCVSSVGNMPFEVPTAFSKGADGLYVVKSRQNQTQQFIPLVGVALSQFLVNSAAFGMPVEGILTAGTLYCRCISNTNTLSNHSYGDAIDITGIRWRSPQGTRETIVHNYNDPAERAILRRINACLRFSFATVIDYHRSDHRDHFHCDMNRGKGRSAKGMTTIYFVQEALNTLLGAGLVEDGDIGPKTLDALGRFSGKSITELGDSNVFNSVLNELFSRMARG